MTASSVAVAAPAAASLPLGPIPDPSSAIAGAAGRLLPHLERGQRVDAGILRAAMEAAFGASDAAGAWDWKSAYEACEAATVLFLRKFGPAMQARAATPAARLHQRSQRPDRQGRREEGTRPLERPRQQKKLS